MGVAELRIGSWVVGHDDLEFQWGFDQFDMVSQNIDVDEIANPIQLTEEWLKKFGFAEKNIDVIPIWIKNGVDVAKRDNFYHNYHPNYNCKIHYVHQLQNLYFALTGEELR